MSSPFLLLPLEGEGKKQNIIIPKSKIRRITDDGTKVVVEYSVGKSTAFATLPSGHDIYSVSGALAADQVWRRIAD